MLFGVVLAVLVSLLALSTLTALSLRQEIHTRSQTHLPAVRALARIERQVESIIALAPQLAAASTQAARRTVMDRAEDRFASVEEQVAMLPANAATAQAVEQLKETLGALADALAALDRQTEANLDARQAASRLFDSLRRSSRDLDALGIDSAPAPADSAEPSESGAFSHRGLLLTLHKAMNGLLMTATLGHPRAVKRLQTQVEASLNNARRQLAAADAAAVDPDLVALLGTLAVLAEGEQGLLGQWREHLTLSRQIENLLRRNQRLSTQIIAATEAVSQSVQTTMETQDRELRTHFLEVLMASLALGTLAILAVAGAFALLRLRVLRRLERVRHAMQGWVRGERHVLTYGDQDEVDAMARAYTLMAEAVEARTDALHRANTDLEAKESRFRLLFSVIPLPLLIHRQSDSTLLDFNAAAAEYYDLGSVPCAWPASVGRLAPADPSLPPPPDASLLQKQMQRFGSVDDLEMRIMAPDGSRRWILASARPLTLEGVSCLLTVHNDITARKEIEEAMRTAKNRAEEALEALSRTQRHLVDAEKTAALTTLLVGLAHEMNTPLGTSVTAASHIKGEGNRLEAALAKGALNRRLLRDFLERHHETSVLLLKNLSRVTTLVETFKELDIMQQARRKGRLALAPVVDRLVAGLRAHRAPVGIQFHVDINPRIILDTYPDALSRVIEHLLRNALDHAYPDGRGGTIRLYALTSETRLQLHCLDDGVGLTEEQKARAFDPFYTTRRNAGAAGLGLHIATTLTTHVLGGRLSLEGETEGGCHVVLDLPWQEM